jgi:SAM-dependent methyltransferase
MNYIFPLEHCFSSDCTKVYIFGAGKIGNDIQKQIDAQNKVVNLGFIDNFITTESAVYDKIKHIGVNKPEILKTTEYDFIVLACTYKLIPEICKCLFDIGVQSEKILLCKQFGQYNPNKGSEWDRYYETAEADADWQVEKFFVPMISKYKIPLDSILDFPSGRGRIAESLYKFYGERISKFVCCDANSEAIDYCKKRFSGKGEFGFSVNKVNNEQLLPLDFPEANFKFIYSWDAMVHFSYRWLDFYISELYKILQNSGFLFIHHSNFGSLDVDVGYTKTELLSENFGTRALVTARDVDFISRKTGFEVIEQSVIDWIIPKLDCITILKKP